MVSCPQKQSYISATAFLISTDCSPTFGRTHRDCGGGGLVVARGATLPHNIVHVGLDSNGHGACDDISTKGGGHQSCSAAAEAAESICHHYPCLPSNLLPTHCPSTTHPPTLPASVFLMMLKGNLVDTCDSCWAKVVAVAPV